MLMLDMSTNHVTIDMTIEAKCLDVLVDRSAIRLLCQLPALIRHRKAPFSLPAATTAPAPSKGALLSLLL